MVLCLLWTAVAGASVSGQQLGVSNPRDILALDPGVFALSLQTTRPEPVSAQAKARTLSRLPEEGEVTKLNASARRKLAALGPLLRATGRDSVYQIKVVDVPLARVGLYQRTVLLISETALALVEADELQALVAHEIGHEYPGTDSERASRLGTTAVSRSWSCCAMPSLSSRSRGSAWIRPGSSRLSRRSSATTSSSLGRPSMRPATQRCPNVRNLRARFVRGLRARPLPDAR